MHLGTHHSLPRYTIHLFQLYYPPINLYIPAILYMYPRPSLGPDKLSIYTAMLSIHLVADLSLCQVKKCQLRQVVTLSRLATRPGVEVDRQRRNATTQARAAVCCSVWRCVAVCCSVLQ